MKNVHRFLIAAMAWLIMPALHAQQLKGHIHDTASTGGMLKLYQARGASFTLVDSTHIGPSGDFNFHDRFNATGFYQLALSDTDQVNLILDAREPLVDLRFVGRPLADHVRVQASDENKRLWELQYVTKETQAVKAAVAEQKSRLLPTDTLELDALDRVEQRAIHTQEQYLEELAVQAPTSFFAKALRVDQAVQGARGGGPMAVAAACDFSDPELLRSTVYDKAVMAFMQNLNAVSEVQFANAADTLMQLASGDTACKAYMLEHLIDLFATYGPESALQHMIDRYVAPYGGSTAVSATVRQKVDALLHVSVGRTAPDVELNDHGTKFQLSQLVKANTYTAVFFYSSTCEHCHAQMPGLKADRSTYQKRGFDVIGIALDVDSTDFLRSIRENAIPWRCYSEFNGWGSKAAQAFQVKATPALFLLDRAMKIVAKPTDAQELRQILKELYD
ncbi:MAG: TlpA family protein disulfide reductase [Flavobacteriales bacterium]|nr:TlpA family protein disulfide reductase [Flavobacteriales bacterium]